MVHSKGKKKNQQKTSLNVLYLYLMADTPEKDFKTTALKVLKEQKEDVEKVKKRMCEQNGTGSSSHSNYIRKKKKK